MSDQHPINGARFEAWKDGLTEHELAEVQRIETMPLQQAIAYSHVHTSRRIDETEEHFNRRVDEIERGHNETLAAARRTSMAKSIGAGIAGGLTFAVPWLGHAFGWDRFVVK